ncbi:F-box protein [Quillaja saponaria]|uniref:F-box protein n=1 Tax=Quillaja saponaria TaxID=32244 RepID=A0AAD7PV28_QUISA|nr:F-box protein [Quillaja saponaria]
MSSLPEKISLPDEDLLNILFRLPVRSLLRFKVVSRHWHFLISCENFEKLLFEFSRDTTPKIFVHAKDGDDYCEGDVTSVLKLLELSSSSPFSGFFHIEEILRGKGSDYELRGSGDGVVCFANVVELCACGVGYNRVKKDFSLAILLRCANVNADRLHVNLWDGGDILSDVGDGLDIDCLEPVIDLLESELKLKGEGENLGWSDWFEQVREHEQLKGEGEGGSGSGGEYEGGKHSRLIAVFICQLKKNSLKRISDFPYYIPHFADHFADPTLSELSVFLNDALHWILKSDREGGKTTILALHLNEEIYYEVPEPKLRKVSDSPYVFLTILGGMLCVTANYSSMCEADVWVMRIYGAGDSWTQLCALQFSEISIVEPVCYSLCRRFILFQQDKTNLVWYKIEGGEKMREVPLVSDSIEASIQAVTCLENLLSFSGSNEGMSEMLVHDPSKGNDVDEISFDVAGRLLPAETM